MKKKLDWEHFFENADFSKAMESFHEEDKELEVFYHSPRFLDLISKIKKELESVPFIHDSEGYNDILFEDVSNEEFNQVFDALFSLKISGIKELQKEDEEDIMGTSFIIFRGLRFEMRYGQGRLLKVSPESMERLK